MTVNDVPTSGSAAGADDLDLIDPQGIAMFDFRDFGRDHVFGRTSLGNYHYYRPVDMAYRLPDKHTLKDAGAPFVALVDDQLTSDVVVVAAEANLKDDDNQQGK